MVNIYLDGALAWSETRVIDGEDASVNFAEVDLSAGTITEL
jgi:hypothetical protein